MNDTRGIIMNLGCYLVHCFFCCLNLLTCTKSQLQEKNPSYFLPSGGAEGASALVFFANNNEHFFQLQLNG